MLVKLDHTKQNLSRWNNQGKKTVVALKPILGKIYYIKINCFSAHISTPKLLHWGFCLYFSDLRNDKCQIEWMHLEKNRTYARTFPVQRKEINVVKVRFNMTYSSRKLNNKKVITTACNFWTQIPFSLKVFGRTNHQNFCTESTLFVVNIPSL